jgi:hypothetical protein
MIGVSRARAAEAQTGIPAQFMVAQAMDLGQQRALRCAVAIDARGAATHRHRKK